MELPVTYKPEVKPKEFKQQNDPALMSWVKNTFNYDNTSKSALFKHQRIVRDYMQLDSPYRGIVLYHGLGVGKTRSAITITEVLVNHKNVIVMLPASLQANFMEELYKFGNELYIKQRYWEWDPKSQLWQQHKRKSNYDTLEKHERDAVDKQINKLIAQRITFIRYNGLRRQTIAKLLSKTFDNHVIIIDEVHNFIGQVVNGSVICRSLYNHIMKANDVKVVCLSGTPLINCPVEYALLLNLAAGFVKYHVIYCKKKLLNDPNTLAEYVQTLRNRNDILRVDVVENKHIHVYTCPDGFVLNNNNNNNMLKRNSSSAPHDITNIINQVFGDKKYIKTDGIKTKIKYLFPIAEDEFNKAFINYHGQNQNDVLNKENEEILIANSRGLISYFYHYNPDDYPSQSDFKLQKIEMTPLQFKEYDEARAKERVLEENDMQKFKKRQKTTKNMFKNIDMNKLSKQQEFNYFRMLSRQRCNIVYHRLKNKGENSDSYLRDATEAKVFSEKRLAMHSPKFARILNHISKAKGPTILYSQYRDESGIGGMRATLESRGWSKISIHKVKGEYRLKFSQPSQNNYIEFKTDKYSQMLIDLFNGNWQNLPPSIMKDVFKTWPDYANHNNYHGEIAKMIFITQSGSEGISLKNVRQVHILEPYWNYVRIQQVVGRAVRARSHTNLPLNERHVDVYLYLMTLAEKEKKRGYDDGISSDELLYNITKRKEMILGKLLNIMKRIAFDCQVHKQAHKIADPHFTCA